jgi:hypothetical protein
MVQRGQALRVKRPTAGSAIAGDFDTTITKRENPAKRV